MFGLKGDGRRVACRMHKDEEHIDLSKAICAVDGCSRTARFGELGERPTACVQHRRPELVDCSTKRCQHVDPTLDADSVGAICFTGANYGDPHERKRCFCRGVALLTPFFSLFFSIHPPLPVCPGEHSGAHWRDAGADGCSPRLPRATPVISTVLGCRSCFPKKKIFVGPFVETGGPSLVYRGNLGECGDVALRCRAPCASPPRAYFCITFLRTLGDAWYSIVDAFIPAEAFL